MSPATYPRIQDFWSRIQHLKPQQLKKACYTDKNKGMVIMMIVSFLNSSTVYLTSIAGSASANYPRSSLLEKIFSKEDSPTTNRTALQCQEQR